MINKKKLCDRFRSDMAIFFGVCLHCAYVGTSEATRWLLMLLHWPVALGGLEASELSLSMLLAEKKFARLKGKVLGQQHWPVQS